MTFGRALGILAVGAALSSGTAMAAETPQGLRADGLRWQAIADAYQQRQDASHYTKLGLQADGLRLRAMAQRYKSLKSRPAASFYTPQALRAEGLRWQAIARAYGQPQVSTISSGGGFNWADAGIGAAIGLGLSLGVAVLIAWGRRKRTTRLAV